MVALFVAALSESYVASWAAVHDRLSMEECEPCRRMNCGMRSGAESRWVGAARTVLMKRCIHFQCG